MSVIRVHDKNFEPYLSSQDILAAVKRLSAEISRDYDGKRPLFIAILNGAFMFASDLFKGVTIEAEISFQDLRAPLK